MNSSCFQPATGPLDMLFWLRCSLQPLTSLMSQHIFPSSERSHSLSPEPILYSKHPVPFIHSTYILIHPLDKYLLGNKYGFLAGSDDKKKNLPAMQETGVWSLGWEDPLEKEMATHSSILDWRIPWTEEPGRLQPMGSKREAEWLTLSLSCARYYSRH